MKSFFILVIPALVIVSCKTESARIDQSDSVAVLKTDTGIASPIVQDSVITEEKKYPVNYSGTYSLSVNDRYENSYIDYWIQLKQIKDSVSGLYTAEYYVRPSNKMVAIFKGKISGIAIQNTGPNASSDLMIDVYEKTIDSLNLNEETRYMMSHLDFNPITLGVRLSKESNTLENNYAGGEWDTWSRLK
jgi:hypothetical protein